MQKRTEVEYATAAPFIRDGDLLLWRHSCRLASWLIAAAGRGEYSHAGMACRVGGELRALEVVQFHGGRSLLLSWHVDACPGRIDWYASGERWPEWDRQKAVKRMARFVGCDYGWWSVLKAGLRHVVVVRWLLPRITDDRVGNGRVPFCSQAVSIACRAGGVDPVPSLPDRLTEPCDLGRTAFFEYRGTLI